MGRGYRPQYAKNEVHDGVAGEQSERPDPTPTDVGSIGMTFEVFDQLLQEPGRRVVKNSGCRSEDRF